MDSFTPRFCLAALIAAFTFNAASTAQSSTGDRKSEQIDKLLAQLGASDFPTREKASAELIKLGAPMLPVLRKAAKGNLELEVKRRIENVMLRIEEGMIRDEEKLWEKLDEPQRGMKERVVKIHTRTPSMNNERLTTAIYLITVGRPPTEDEVKANQTRFLLTQVRMLEAMKLARSLVQNNGGRVEVMTASAKLFQLQKKVHSDADLATQLARLNGPEHQKLLADVASNLRKVAKSDEQFCELAFLLALSRFPDRSQFSTVTEYLKKAPERSQAGVEVVWALINSAEFIKAP